VTLGSDYEPFRLVAGGHASRWVCRYALRPPIARDRIRLTADGDVLLELRHRWSDGTTHLRFHPLELLERLASLTPRPRINLVLYYGLFAAHAAWRARVHAADHADSGSSGLPVPGVPGVASVLLASQAAAPPKPNRIDVQHPFAPPPGSARSRAGRC